MKKLRNVLVAVVLCGVLFAASNAGKGGERMPELAMAAPQESFVPPAVADADAPMPEFGDEQPDDLAPAAPPMNRNEDYERVRLQNADVAGWLAVPNTRINYPVLLGKDNDYYLHNDVNRQPAKAGAVFMDFRNGEPGRRRAMILYGHNMKNGSMFHDLCNYKVKDFFENNRTFTLWLGDEEQTYEIYAAYIVSAKVNYIRTQFENDEDFISYFKGFQEMSKFKPSPAVELKAADTIVTLSTCTYELDDSRFVVQARRVR